MAISEWMLKDTQSCSLSICTWVPISQSRHFIVICIISKSVFEHWVFHQYTYKLNLCPENMHTRAILSVQSHPIIGNMAFYWEYSQLMQESLQICMWQGREWVAHRKHILIIMANLEHQAWPTHQGIMHYCWLQESYISWQPAADGCGWGRNKAWLDIRSWVGSIITCWWRGQGTIITGLVARWPIVAGRILRAASRGSVGAIFVWAIQGAIRILSTISVTMTTTS